MASLNWIGMREQISLAMLLELQRENKIKRDIAGQHLPEFTAAFTILLLGVFVPLINLSIVPVRYGMVQSQFDARIHELAQLGRLSEAIKADDATALNQNALNKISGCNVRDEQVHLCISSMKRTDRTINISDPGTITSDWLPDGALSPCDYSLVLQAQVDISPIVTFALFGAKIPGLTGPLTCEISKAAEWENSGRDAATGKFFINE